MLGLVINCALGLVKLIGGWLGDSFALLSDAVNSLGDGLSSAVVVVALWYAQRPADDDHPYGHTRAESIAAANVALFIILSACVIGWEALQRWGTAHGIPPLWTLWIAAANIAIKETLYRYKMTIGRQTGSTSLMASALDHRSDALCSLAVLAGLCIVRWGGPAYMWADELAALFVVAIILWSGGRLYLENTRDLLDLQANESYVAEIRRIAESIEGVLAVEKLRVRKSGMEYLADLHLQVDPQSTVREGHRIGHVVRDQLVSSIASLRDVLVHLEPFEK